MANGSPNQGWYEDPKDPAIVRWWDGSGWSHHTQPKPGASAPAQPEAVAPEPAQQEDPWAAVQQPEQPEQGQQSEQPQWGQQSEPQQPQWGQQSEQPQWGQQSEPQQPQWGQQSEQPQQPQWGQQSEQPQQPQWGQQPEQPQWGQQSEQPQWGQQSEQPQWGQQSEQPQQPQWGQQPEPQQPQWGQQPVTGWQPQQPQTGWGSALPPGPVPGGLAPGSPMGQANVFPTSGSIDPITGMPVGSGIADSGSGTNPKRLAALVAGALLVGLLVIALLWFFLFRSSGTTTGSGSVNVTATFSGTVDPACQDLGGALTADGLSDTVAVRLNDVAIAKDLEDNQSYFTQLGSDIQPIMDQYQSACIAAVAAGNAPEFYRTFVETFETSVSDGAEVATTALAAAGQVPPEDAERLRAEASKLDAAGKAVMAISGTPAPTASPVPTTGVTTAPSVAPSAVAPTPTP